MAKLANWIKETVSGTPGTGTINLSGTAVSGYIRFQDSGLLATTNQVHYLAEDGANRELGIGVLTTGTPWTLTRGVILATLDTGVYDDTSPSAISLTSSATISCVEPAQAKGIVVHQAYANTTALATISTVCPIDDTQPLAAEMSDVITVSFTPKFADSSVIIEGFVTGSSSAAQTVVAGIFKDGGDALGVSAQYNPTSTYTTQLNVAYQETSGSTTARTYKLRLGINSSGNFYVNGTNSAGRRFGGYSNSYIKVTEYRS